jgi:hypothetical protein
MSEIKVNKISPKQTCTQLTLGDSGDTIIVTSGANLNTDTIKNLNSSSIITQTNATTITLGFSGSTIAIASGASQTGFGRSGTVNWDTTAKTSSPVTAVSGTGYFINTTSGAITVNLPAGTAGDIVAVSDYANTAATNNITINPNGTDKINGVNQNAKISTNGASITLVYVDATRGWKDVNDATLDLTGLLPFVAATGGTILTCGDYKTHVFTGPGTFTVTSAGSPGGSNSVEYLVVAGGGGGGAAQGAGGGAGGFRTYTALPAASPLNGPAALPVSVQGYPITVGGGGGGSPGTPRGTSGNPSIFSTITSTGGGGGGSYPSNGPGLTGGSGGGGGSRDVGGGTGGTGNTPPVSPSQGNDGSSTGPLAFGGGGGGAGAAAGPGSKGGDGSFVPTGFFGPTAPSYGETGPSGRYFSGGGGGRPASAPPGTGGLGGGGDSAPAPAKEAIINTGGGGGGGGQTSPDAGGSGGSGIVVIRYKFQ